MTEQKKYVLYMARGQQRRITIPADWKVTYGPIVPGSGMKGGSLCFRVYESKEKQRLCLMDVIGFREESIPLEVLRSDAERLKLAQEMAGEGGKVWVNTDEDNKKVILGSIKESIDQSVIDAVSSQIATSARKPVKSKRFQEADDCAF